MSRVAKDVSRPFPFPIIGVNEDGGGRGGARGGKREFLNGGDGNASCYSLEEIRVVDVSEEGHGVGQHPNIAAAAIVIRLRPSAILVSHCQDFVLLPLRVHALVERVRV